MMPGVWPSGVPMAARALPDSCNPKPPKHCHYISCEANARAQGIQQESTITSLAKDPILMHTDLVTASMPLNCFINRLLLTMDSKDLETMLEDAMPMAYMD